MISKQSVLQALALLIITATITVAIVTTHLSDGHECVTLEYISL